MPQNLQSIFTAQCDVIESLSSYKYPGFVLDVSPSFKLHIKQLMKKLRLWLGFYYRKKSCFYLLLHVVIMIF